MSKHRGRFPTDGPGSRDGSSSVVDSPELKKQSRALRSAQERKWAAKSGNVTVRRVDPELMKDGWPEVGEGEIVEVVKARKPRRRRRKVRELKAVASPVDPVEAEHWDALRRERAAAERQADAERVELDWKPFLVQDEIKKFGGYMAAQSAKRRAAGAA